MRTSTLTDMFELSAKQFATRSFIGEKKGGAYQWLTYQQFADATNQARGGLASLGVHKGDRVAIISDNCVPWAILSWGTYTLGAVFVPMYEAQAPKEWAFIVGDSEAKVVICRSRATAEKYLTERASNPSVQHVVLIDTSGGVPDGVLSYEELLARGQKSPAPITAARREDLADIIYTSGTTGMPKGVMLTHANIADNIEAFHEFFVKDAAGETSLAMLPWAHVFGQVVELHGGFAHGDTVALVESPLTLAQNLAEIKPTILFSVPRVYNRLYSLLKAKGADAATIRGLFGGRVKFAISGAAALSAEVAKYFSEAGVTICEGYGLTETSPVATFNPTHATRAGTVGLPIPGITVRIDKDVDGAHGEHGEIVIAGHNIMKGYYKRPEETAKVILPDGAFRSGDLGYIDSEGYLHITGRVKEQYKLENGKYVAPAPLEEQLKLCPLIAQAYIYGANKPHNVALIVPNAETVAGWAAQNGLGGKPMAELVKEPKLISLINDEINRLSGGFKGFEKIASIALVSEEFSPANGLLTPTLKVKRNAVYDRYKKEIEALYTAVV